MKNSSKFKEAFKTTSLFGSVQLFTILITIARSKIVASLLGPTGMGIINLITSTLGLIAALTNFGLDTSAVKNVAQSYGSGDSERFNTTIFVFRRIVWITGLLGTILTIVFAKQLSQFVFGNADYTFGFMIVSITLLVNQVSLGQKVVLRGTRKVAYMAKATIWGASLGLLVSTPLYYYFKLEGVIPSIIISSIIALATSNFYARKLEIKVTRVDKKAFFGMSSGMLKMGFLISLSGLITLGSSYLIRVYLGRISSVEEVGFFSAAFAIVGTYVGMIFNAMSADYYPRLVTVINDSTLYKQTVNQQLDIAILLLGPILIALMVFVKIGVILLYTVEFTPIIPMIRWMIIGVLFKAGGWALSYIFLAKGATWIFFLNEVLYNILFVLFSYIGFGVYGLQGVGIAFLISYTIYFCQVFLFSKAFFKFKLSKGALQTSVIQLSLMLIIFGIILFAPESIAIFMGCIILLISTMYSLWILNRNISLKDTLKRKFKKGR